MTIVAYQPKPAMRSSRAFLAVSAFALTLNPFALARADACTTDATSTAACTATPAQTRARRSYIDAARNYELSTESTSDALPWISQAQPADAAEPAPIAVNPTDAGVNARASLGQIRDYNAKLTAKKIEAAKAFAPKAVAPAAAQSPIDVWTTFDAQGLEGPVDQTKRAAAGAEYKLTKKTTVGVAAERGVTESAIAPSADQKVSATVNYKAAPALSIEAKTQWEETTTVGAATEKNSVSIAPRVGKKYALEDGKTLEPFVTYRQELGVGAGAVDQTTGFATSQSAGAGLTYAKPDAYSVSVTTDVENVGAKDPASLNSKLQLKLPID